MNGDIHTIHIVCTVGYIYLIFILVVVNLQQPTSRNLLWISSQVILFRNLHTILAYTDFLRQHIETYIVAVEDHLYWLLCWRI